MSEGNPRVPQGSAAVADSAVESYVATASRRTRANELNAEVLKAITRSGLRALTRDALAQPGFQRHAVALLLATPSRLNRAWLGRSAFPDGTQVPTLETAITELNFGPISGPILHQFVLDKRADATFVALIAEISDDFADGYGTEPHPDFEEAVTLVRVMRELDGE